jgi:hypothetical protein
VILKSLIDRDSSHPDIDAGLQGITFGIQAQNRRMLYDSVAQQNHVNVMMKRLFLVKASSVPFNLQRVNERHYSLMLAAKPPAIEVTRGCSRNFFRSDFACAFSVSDAGEPSIAAITFSISIETS